jgi:uncharacterized protein
MELSPVNVAETTADERSMATLAQVLQLVGGWIAPLIILLIKRESRFVSFHALQVLLLQIVHVMVWMGIMVAWLAVIFVFALQGSHGKPPLVIFLVFPMIWVGAMAVWIVILVIAIIYGIKANRGEWAEYPLLGGIARRILKLGPGGVPLSA